MHEAIAALPPKLQESARIIDHTPPPRDRPWPMWATPPIKGFDDTPYAKAEEGLDSDDEEDDEQKVAVRPAVTDTQKKVAEPPKGKK
jgi:hypothetical protein